MICTTWNALNADHAVNKFYKSWRVNNLGVETWGSSSTLSKTVTAPWIYICWTFTIFFYILISANYYWVIITTVDIYRNLINKVFNEYWWVFYESLRIINSKLTFAIWTHWVYQTVWSQKQWMFLSTGHLSNSYIIWTKLRQWINLLSFFHFLS